MLQTRAECGAHPLLDTRHDIPANEKAMLLFAFDKLLNVQPLCVVVHHAWGKAEFAAGGGAVSVVVRD